MKFIKYIFSLFIIVLGINNVFATGLDVLFITKDIENPETRLCLNGREEVSSVSYYDYYNFDIENENNLEIMHNKFIVFVFDSSNMKGLTKKYFKKILNLKDTSRNVIASFGTNKIVNDLTRRYIPNLSDDIREIKDYIHRKANGISGSTSESRISSVDSSSELSSEDNECSSRLSNLTTTNTPSKVIFAGAGVQRPETTQHHKSKIRRSENSNIKKAQKLDFDELAENEKAEEAKKAEEEAKEVAISVQPEEQTDEKIQPVQNDRNGMILPSEESQDVSIDVSTRVIDEKTKLIENKDSEDEEEKNIKKSTCGCTIL